MIYFIFYIYHLIIIKTLYELKLLMDINCFYLRAHLLNKSAADMQHTPPRNIFNAKKIYHFETRPFMQSLKKIGKEMPKMESEKTIYNVNQVP